MKGEVCIGFISRWNATCGVSLHAELIGREFLRNGINIKVFAPYLESANRWWHHISICSDEPYVIRCFSEISPKGEDGRIDRERILNERIDGLIVESWQSLPKDDVEKIVWELKKKGIPSVLIIHDGFRKDITYKNMDMFKKVLIFHEGYKEILKGKVSEKKIEVVPYPYLPPVKRQRRFAEDGIIRFLSFGRQPKQEYEDYIEVLKEIAESYPICYKVIRGDEVLPYEYSWLEQEKRVLLLDEIYDILGSTDIHLIPKGDTKAKVVSSTLAQTLGSLAIHVAPATAYFEDVNLGKDSPLFLYKDRRHLKEGILRIIEEPIFRKRLQERARIHAEKNSVQKIALRILELINPVFLEDIKKVVNF